MPVKDSKYWSGTVQVAIIFEVEVFRTDRSLNETMAREHAVSTVLRAIKEAGKAESLEPENRMLFIAGVRSVDDTHALRSV